MISRENLDDTSQSLTQFVGPPQCQLTEIIKPNDPRANFPKTMETKYGELRDLINIATIPAVLKTELPDGANLITARYVLSIKSDKYKEERYKARYVAGGYLDIMKDYLVRVAQTNQCASVRIILVFAKIKRFRIWVVDVKLVYLQSDKPLMRKMFSTNPAPEFELSLRNSWSSRNQFMA